jgi:hypothetical protein
MNESGILLGSVYQDAGIVSLINLLNESEFWLVMDCENILAEFINQLRRTNVEGTIIEISANQKNTSMSSVETGDKMNVSSGSIEQSSKDQRLRLEAIEWKLLRRMKTDNRLKGEGRGRRLGAAASAQIKRPPVVAPSSSADLEALRSGFRAEMAAASEALRAEIWAMKSSCGGWLSGVFGSFQKASSIFLKESAACWDFPAIFEDFKEQKFTLPWRGGRDGFKRNSFTAAATGTRTL